MTCCSQSKIHKFYSCSRNRRQLFCMFPYCCIEIRVSPSGSVHPRSIVTTWKWGAHDVFRRGKRLDTISVFLCWSCPAPFLLICLIGSAGAVWFFPMSPSSHEWLVIPPALFIRFFPLLPEKSWPESSWFGKGKGWAHFTGKDSSVSSLQFIVSAVTATFLLAGLWCGILVGISGKWIAVADRHERGYICTCGHCKLLLCVQDLGFAWINISCSLFMSKDYVTLGARWEGLGVYTIKLTRALHKCSFVSLRQAPSFIHSSYSSWRFVMLINLACDDYL